MEEEERLGATVSTREEGPSALAAYARVPIAFEVRSQLRVGEVSAGFGGLSLVEAQVDPPWVKDYDAESGPLSWAREVDLTSWGILSAWAKNGERIGGAAVAWGSRDVAMLDGRTDLAVLWDIRVRPDARSRGVGTALFRAAEQWAAARDACWLKVETQNINVPACRFYMRMGCTLGAINRFAYPSLPEETQLLWYKRLASGG